MAGVERSAARPARAAALALAAGICLLMPQVPAAAVEPAADDGTTGTTEVTLLVLEDEQDDAAQADAVLDLAQTGAANDAPTVLMACGITLVTCGFVLCGRGRDHGRH